MALYAVVIEDLEGGRHESEVEAGYQAEAEELAERELAYCVSGCRVVSVELIEEVSA